MTNNKNVIFVIINVLIFNKSIYADNCAPKMGKFIFLHGSENSKRPKTCVLIAKSLV